MQLFFSSRFGRGCLTLFMLILLASWGHAAPLMVDVSAAPYNVSPNMSAEEQTRNLQNAITAVCNWPDGGKVIIPGNTTAYTITRPLAVWSANHDVEIVGSGRSTSIQCPYVGNNMVFLLGLQPNYANTPLTSGHYPLLTGVFDNSVTAPKYGLCTYDGATRASGYFPASPLAFGSTTPQTYKRSETDVRTTYPMSNHLESETVFTLDLCLRNDTMTPVSGTICGAGAGGAQGDITDPRTIWTVESHNGVTTFNYRVQHMDRCPPALQVYPWGHATALETKHLTVATTALRQGVHRISVQLDFATGQCRAWYSCNSTMLTSSGSGLNLGTNYRFQPLDYGALRLGATTDSCFSGAPAAPQQWTFCGLRIGNAVRYATVNGGQSPALTDNVRFFNADGHANTIGFLPLNAPSSALTIKSLVTTMLGAAVNDLNNGPVNGFWLPCRPSAPMNGMITLRNMEVANNGHGTGVDFGVFEAGHVQLKSLHALFGAFYTLCTFDCPIARQVECDNCHFECVEAEVFAKSCQISLKNTEGGGGRNVDVLVGCWGIVQDQLFGPSSVFNEYHIKCFAGPAAMPVRGKLTLSNICDDNENQWSTFKGVVYAEPSLNASPDGNTLEIYGIPINSDMPDAGVSESCFIELADPPNVDAAAIPNAKVTIDAIFNQFNAAQPMTELALVNSPHWIGRINDCYREALYDYGLLKLGVTPQYPNGLMENQCHVVTYMQDGNTVPTTGGYNGVVKNWHWFAGCHVLLCPTPGDTPPHYTAYRCTTSGVNGNARWTTDKAN